MRLKKKLKVILIIIPILLISLLVLQRSFVRWYDVPTRAMIPTILDGDRVFVNHAAYDLMVPLLQIPLHRRADPTDGDIIMFRSPEDRKYLIKRVVALPGDVVEVRGSGHIFLNGEEAAYSEPDSEVFEKISRWVEVLIAGHALLISERMADHEHMIMILESASMPPFGPFRVPDDHYFVLGDNRMNSRDSRWFGPVPRNLVLGKAFSVAFSVDYDHGTPRWERLSTPLQ